MYLKIVTCLLRGVPALCSLTSTRSFGLQTARNLSAIAKPKRFYKNVSVVQAVKGWEINLDNRKLKTPTGKPLLIASEALATAVATEWSIQTDVVERHSMHLTALCNTAQDNPHKKTAEQLCEEIIEFLENDSLLFRVPRNEQRELYELQSSKWDPIVEWFCDKHQIILKPSEDVLSPGIDPVTVLTVYKYLFSYQRTALFGFQFGVECLKSLILTQAAVDRRLTVQEAVELSRLETNFQTAKWGSVEWSHELDNQQVAARLAAAVTFMQLSQEVSTIREKSSSTV
ncbi:ATP synthase mitochondrial F1 complex assembly factor 2-like [Tropilaelaps mercedesae]|uniref:ATP synthase mitochondrial F1 complex assembly factor 2-like n=1 Tax=Tropilaelaps mercedesae TaxID=418985 RepID=A0A1V9XSY5_9ACAR|nr:ATP synthase mitochondrial F1 complex assembly factor 2-like [Tropilaelaps mercedesae]